jgi:hypothetical protein
VEGEEDVPRRSLVSDALAAVSSRLFIDRPPPPQGQTDVLLQVFEKVSTEPPYTQSQPHSVYHWCASHNRTSIGRSLSPLVPPLPVQAVCSGSLSLGVLQGWSSSVEASLNQPPSLWSTVPRLSPEATALLPQDYRLPVGSNWPPTHKLSTCASLLTSLLLSGLCACPQLSGVEVSRCRVTAFLALRALYRRLQLGPHDNDDEIQGVAGRPLIVEQTERPLIVDTKILC